MPTILHHQVQLVSMECCQCGIVFAIPTSLDDKYEREGGDWCCPNGHWQHYVQTREQKLRHKLDQAEAEIEKLQKQVTRVNKGVCPYCRRHFANVERHIHTKHKDKLAGAKEE